MTALRRCQYNLSMAQYDLVVIGSGPGGYIAAIRAAQLGMKVAVVERDKAGGVCANWGCIPSKALIKCADVYTTLRHAADYGIDVEGLGVDFQKVVKRSRKAATLLSKGVEYLFKKNGVDFVAGTASFLAPGRLAVQAATHTREIEASNVLIATGTSPLTLPGLPVDGKGVITSDEALILKRVPESMVVVGGGAVGVEFAYVFAAFGCDVTIVEMAPHLLPHMDAEVARELERAFKSMGIGVYTSSRFKSHETRDGLQVVHVEDTGRRGEEHVLEAEVVLVAVGRKALIEPLAPGAVGLEVDDRGFIKVDDAYRTTAEGVYAIGDVIGPPLLAHKASEEGVRVVEMLAGEEGQPVDYDNIPSCIYCQPEVASVGLTEEQCRERGLSYSVGRFPFRANGKAIATGDARGFVKIITNNDTGEIVGAHIIGRGAAEMISEVALAKTLESTPFEMGITPHPHPTFSEALREAALASLGRARNI